MGKGRKRLIQYGLFLLVALYGMSCAMKGTKEEERKGRYDVEIDENVKGEDSSLRSGLYSLSLLKEYSYDQDALLSEFRSTSSGKSLEDRVKTLTIRRLLGHKKEAVEGLHRLLEDHPKNKLILQNLANAYLDLGNYEFARLILYELISKNKGDAALRNNLGMVHYRLGKTADAIIEWKRAVVLVPSHVDARLNLAAVAMEHGNFDESLNLCQDVLKNEPRNADANLCVCTSTMGQGKFKEADDCYNSAEGRTGRWETLSWNRAFSLYRTGKLKEAQSRIERYLVTRRRSLDPKSPIFAFLQQLKLEIKASEMAPPAPAQPSSPAPSPEPVPEEAPPAQENSAPPPEKAK